MKVAEEAMLTPMVLNQIARIVTTRNLIEKRNKTNLRKKEKKKKKELSRLATRMFRRILSNPELISLFLALKSISATSGPRNGKHFSNFQHDSKIEDSLQIFPGYGPTQRHL